MPLGSYTWLDRLPLTKDIFIKKQNWEWDWKWKIEDKLAYYLTWNLKQRKWNEALDVIFNFAFPKCSDALIERVIFLEIIDAKFIFSIWEDSTLCFPVDTRRTLLVAHGEVACWAKEVTRYLGVFQHCSIWKYKTKLFLMHI